LASDNVYVAQIGCAGIIYAIISCRHSAVKPKKIQPKLDFY